MKAKKNKLPADSALKYPADASARASSRRTPTHEEISARAYWIWVELGYPAGRDLEHWLQAERELLEAGPAEMPREPRDLEDDASLSNGADRQIGDLLMQDPPK